MHKLHVSLLALAALVFVRAALFAQPGRARNRGTELAAGHGWLHDYRQAKRVARRTGKPLMVAFRCVP